MRLLVIFNEKAGNGRARRLLPDVMAAADRLDLDLDVQMTSGSGHAVELVASRSLAGYQGVVAAGGDGTLFEVATGMFRNPESACPPLGVLPIGTGNSFSLDLGLEGGDVYAALSRIAAADNSPTARRAGIWASSIEHSASPGPISVDYAGEQLSASASLWPRVSKGRRSPAA